MNEASGKGGASKSTAKDSGANSDEEELTLESRLRRLDEIVGQLEGGDIELERGLTLFEEGVRHIRSAEALLAAAELKVEELVGEVESLGVEPMEERDG